MISLPDFNYDQLLSNEQTIQNIISEPALFEQLAEECSELAQACLKKARKIRGENFTPKTNSEIDQSIIEEYTDVMLVGNVLKLHTDRELYSRKLQRWINRNE